MSEELIVTLLAQAGNKPGQPVAFYGSGRRSSIVFLPNSAPVDQQVRVRLETIKNPDGTDKLDRGGKPMYRAKPAPNEIKNRWFVDGEEIVQIEIPVNWLGQEVEEEAKLLERRKPQERFGAAFTNVETKLVWGADLESSEIETTITETTPIEKEVVKNGRLYWERVDLIKVEKPSTRSAVTSLDAQYGVNWYGTHMASRDVVTVFARSSDSSCEHQSKWTDLPEWYRKQLSCSACGRDLVDTRPDDFPYCKVCKCGHVADCDRCGKAVGDFSQIDMRVLCKPCARCEESEGLIQAELSDERLRKLARQAEKLLAGQAFQGQDGEVISRSLGQPIGGGQCEWYYLTESGFYGSKFPPAALKILTALSQAQGDGLVELISWFVADYYQRSQAGEQVFKPRLTSQNLRELSVGKRLWKRTVPSENGNSSSLNGQLTINDLKAHFERRGS